MNFEADIITRNDLKYRLHRYLDFSDMADLTPAWSTGTSGDPICIYRNSHDHIRFWRILLEKSQLQKPEVAVLFLCTLPQGREYSFTQYCGNYTINITRLNVFISNAKTILSTSPDLVTTSPDGLKFLLRQQTIGLLDTAKLFYSTALPLMQNLRDEFADRFSMPLLHTYSTTETGPIAYQCPQNENSYHIFSDMQVEVIGDSILVTKKFKSALPLKRYQTGDRALLSNSPCSCGHSGPSLNGLKGRKLPSFSESF